MARQGESRAALRSATRWMSPVERDVVGIGVGPNASDLHCVVSSGCIPWFMRGVRVEGMVRAPAALESFRNIGVPAEAGHYDHGTRSGPGEVDTEAAGVELDRGFGSADVQRSSSY